MDDDLPWARYEKDRLPRGWGWPLTRSTVAELLREQEVVVDELHFGMPLLPADLSRVWLVSARIPGNAVSPATTPGRAGEMENGPSREETELRSAAARRGCAGQASWDATGVGPRRPRPTTPA